jgi:hypothetical protein
MNENNGIKRLVNEEIQYLDDYIERSGKIMAVIPIVSERRKEAEVKRLILNELPEDVLSETTVKLSVLQEKENQKTKQYLPLPVFIDEKEFEINCSSGSTSAFVQVYSMASTSSEKYPHWAPNVREKLYEISEDRKRSQIISKSLYKIAPKLIDLYKKTLDNIEKSDVKILELDHSLSRM